MLQFQNMILNLLSSGHARRLVSDRRREVHANDRGPLRLDLNYKVLPYIQTRTRGGRRRQRRHEHRTDPPPTIIQLQIP